MGDEFAVLILAGGEATRLPGKLEAPFFGKPLVAHVYENVSGHWPVFVSVRGTFEPALDRALECPMIVDRFPGRGPLAAVLSASGEIRQRFLFVVAADAPRVSVELLQMLAGARERGDEAVVPEHDGHLEPLAALYDRQAVLREGFALLRNGNGAMHALLDRLAMRIVQLPGSYFVNINTAADVAAAHG